MEARDSQSPSAPDEARSRPVGPNIMTVATVLVAQVLMTLAVVLVVREIDRPARDDAMAAQALWNSLSAEEKELAELLSTTVPTLPCRVPSAPDAPDAAWWAYFDCRLTQMASDPGLATELRLNELIDQNLEHRGIKSGVQLVE